MGDVACGKYRFHYHVIGKISYFFYWYLVKLKVNAGLAQVPNLVEIKKLEKSTGDDHFMQWREALLAARKPSNSPPTCTIEDL